MNMWDWNIFSRPVIRLCWIWIQDSFFTVSNTKYLDLKFYSFSRWVISRFTPNAIFAGVICFIKLLQTAEIDLCFRFFCPDCGWWRWSLKRWLKHAYGVREGIAGGGVAATGLHPPPRDGGERGRVEWTQHPRIMRATPLCFIVLSPPWMATDSQNYTHIQNPILQSGGITHVRVGIAPRPDRVKLKVNSSNLGEIRKMNFLLWNILSSKSGLNFKESSFNLSRSTLNIINIRNTS